MRGLSRQTLPAEEENPYWMSFADVMSALLIIFILAAVALIMQLMEIQRELRSQQRAFQQEIEDLHHAEEVRRTILHEIAEKLHEQGIQVIVSENDTLLSIPNEVLGFGTAEFEIAPAYQQTAIKIGAVLVEVIKRGHRLDYIDTIFVEGHTDERAFRGLMGKGNWGLSSFRAISLWQLWRANLPNSHQLLELRNRNEEPLFSVSGYSSTRPLKAEQSSEQDYRIHRRIDIRFTIRRPDIAEYHRVSEIIDEVVP